jgi:predicted nucleotidyltransferase
MQRQEIKNKIVTHLAGSHAYGLNTPESDTDIRGIFCGDEVSMRTPFFPIREAKIEDEEDTSYYELSNYCKLAADNNPNVLESIWVDEESIIDSSDAYKLMRASRDLFMSSRLAFTTTGYATAQLRKLKSRERWINNPQPKEPPQPKDYLKVTQYFGEEKLLKPNLNDFWEDHKLIHYGNHIYGLYEYKGYKLWTEKGGHINSEHKDDYNEKQPIFLVKFCEKQYDQDKINHENYWRWKKNRNEYRAGLEAEHGFDCKNASHLVRLMITGEHALKTGEYLVKMPEDHRQTIKDVRAGKWTYKEVLDFGEEKDQYIRGELYKTTDLPKTADRKRIAELILQIQDIYWPTRKQYSQPNPSHI